MQPLRQRQITPAQQPLQFCENVTTMFSRDLPRLLCWTVFMLAMGILPGQLREKRVTPVDSKQTPGFATRSSVGVAILVGIGNYPPFTGLERLRFPGRDVDLLKKELESQRYTVVTLKDQEATRA